MALQSATVDLPVFDEICKRSLRFIAACLSHHCDLVRFFAWLVLCVLQANR